MTFGELRMQVHPGHGIVANFGSALVVCLPNAASQYALADGLLACVDAASTDGPYPARSIARGIADLVGRAAGPTDVPAFAVLSPSEDGIAIILQGAIEFELEQHGGRSVLSGRDALTWVDRVIKGEFLAIEIRGCDSGSQPDQRSRLEAGVVPGAGVTALAAGQPSRSARVSLGAGSPAEQPPQNAPPPPTPLPDPPESVVPARSEPTPATPGVLVGDDGSTLELDDSYVLGREPFDHPQVAGGVARPFVFLDSDTEISRAHTLVSVSGIDVTVTDLGSANGTFIAAPDSGVWQKLTPGVPTPIRPGYWLLVGQRTFEFRPAVPT